MSRFQSAFATRERRKARRYEVQVAAMITPEGETLPLDCTIQDISQTGALIEVENGKMIDKLTLTFSRECWVVRRNKEGNRLGVEFLLPWSVPVEVAD